MKRGRAVTGTVTHAGAPVPGATVVLAVALRDAPYTFTDRDPLLDTLDDTHVTRTNAGGHFSFDGIGRGPWTLAADHPDHDRSPPTIIPATDSDARVDLVMP